VSVLDRVVVVLLEPQNPVNIAATIRAMRNMGLSALRLVRPVAYTPEQIETIAHDTMDLVAAARHFDDLDGALADCVDVIAYTARRRAAKRTVLTPREAAARLVGGEGDGPVAMMFGREDAGLPNDALDRAHGLCTIPTTEHGSLNLAQAVMVAAYELHLAAGDATRVTAPPKHDAPPATATQYGQLFEDLERALVAIEFFKTRYPEHVMRTARSLAYRAAPTAREIELARAMAIEVLRTLERTRIISRDS
jgi:tRNA/rRNA methyltransferase/tRNA (cytidine32/uridine32-2'-O)-methyltransferase